jgi:hypothetical protein
MPMLMTMVPVTMTMMPMIDDADCRPRADVDI